MNILLTGRSGKFIRCSNNRPQWFSTSRKQLTVSQSEVLQRNRKEGKQQWNDCGQNTMYIQDQGT